MVSGEMNALRKYGDGWDLTYPGFTSATVSALPNGTLCGEIYSQEVHNEQ